MQQTDELRRQKINAQNAAYRAANPEKVKAWNARYRANNPDRFRKSQRDYKRKRYHADPEYRLITQLRSRLAKVVGRGATAAVANCGCTPRELMQNLESMFDDDMTWSRRSEWHVDHIYPLAAIDASNELHVRAVNNWRNLRPVWAADNRAKSSNVTADAQALFFEILRFVSTPEDYVDAAEV
jgi:hypothetical protein